MSTERLYFSDVTCATFRAAVTQRGTHAGHPAVVLDRTAFYPEGGGQPADRGTLDAIPVIDVQDVDGVIWHILAAPLPEGAGVVQGVIDWPRRWDHMQQHGGQHLLSAVLEELTGRATVSFHLGEQTCTIDCPGPPLDPATLTAVEERVNQIIVEARPIQARIVAPPELEQIPLRKAATVAGPVRVVSIQGVDHSACGGTHPWSTAGIGMLAVLGQTRRGTEIRLAFLAGGRVLGAFHRATALLDTMARRATVGPDELPAVLRRLEEGATEARKTTETLQHLVAGYEATRLVDEARRRTDTGTFPIVSSSAGDEIPIPPRALADAIVTRGGIAIVTGSTPKPLILLAAPTAADLDAGALLRRVLQPLGGRGGGTATLAQGGLPTATDLPAAAVALEHAVRQVIIGMSPTGPS